MKRNHIFALVIVISLLGYGFSEPEPFLGKAGDLLGGFGGAGGLGAAGGGLGGLTGAGGGEKLGILKGVLDVIVKRNLALQALSKFPMLFQFLNMTRKITNLVGFADYECKDFDCTGLAYCFGLTKQFAVNMSLCSENVETTTQFVENSPNAEKMNVR